MGWVPPGPPVRGPGTTDESYRKALDDYGDWLDRRIARYRASVGPWMLAAAILLPIMVIAAALRWVTL